METIKTISHGIPVTMEYMTIDDLTPAQLGRISETLTESAAILGYVSMGTVLLTGISEKIDLVYRERNGIPLG